MESDSLTVCVFLLKRSKCKDIIRVNDLGWPVHNESGVTSMSIIVQMMIK